MSPLVSIIVPAYQVQDQVGGTVSSLLMQTHPHVEIIVVDDGCTDNTADVLRAYGDRITLIQQENQGIAGGRNTGIQAAKGDFIAFMDADDLAMPNFVESGLAAYHAAGGGRRIVIPDGWCLTPTGISDALPLRGRPMPPEERQRFELLQYNFNNVFALAPRSLFDEVGLFNVDYRACEDWEFWSRAVFHEWRFVANPAKVCMYRFTPNSVSSKLEDMRLAENAVAARTVELFGDQMTQQERDYMAKRLTHDSARHYLSQAHTAIRDNDLVAAGKFLKQASAAAPSDRRLAARAAIAQNSVTSWVVKKRREILDRKTGFTKGMTR